jgi:hypothetical protein
MIDKIEVYVRNEEVVTGQTIIGRPMSDGLTTHYCTAKEALKTERVMPEADRLTLAVVYDFANAKELKVEVHDVTTFKGKLKASLKGIKTTPTIIIGKLRIEGEQSSELLKSKLESYFNK